VLRRDISRAVDATPDHIRAEIVGSAAASLALLNDHLAADETVEAITSVAASSEGATTCVLAITSRRLVFVAPAPQAVAWRLSSVTKSQSFAGYFFIEGDAGSYSLGMQDGEWGKAFEGRIKLARTIAVLGGL
jgi:hypothetical protein